MDSSVCCLPVHKQHFVVQVNTTPEGSSQPQKAAAKAAAGALTPAAGQDNGVMDVLENTLWNRQLGVMSEEIVAALVCQIFEGTLSLAHLPLRLADSHCALFTGRSPYGQMQLLLAMSRQSCSICFCLTGFSTTQQSLVPCSLDCRHLKTKACIFPGKIACQ